MAKRNPSWAVAEAKARFSALIAAAVSNGPQTVTRNGKGTVVVVSLAEWERKSRRTGNLAEFFAGSPLRGSRLKIERVNDAPRAIRL
jgi:prevent-host-death family protein